MALQKRCWQVHSTVTRKVRLQKQRKARVHAVCAKMKSGQLPFLGSDSMRPALPRTKPRLNGPCQCPVQPSQSLIGRAFQYARTRRFSRPPQTP